MRKFHSIALVVSLGLSLAVAPSVQAKAKPKAFNGKTCTIVGTSKSEKLNGTSKDDVICGLGGNDTINGLSGNDTIDGGTGNDILSGGENNDAIDGGTGNDTINGGNGNDSLTGDSGNDSLLGGAGNDALQGETGADVFSGGTGTDTAKYSEKTTGLTIDIDSNADDGATGEKDNIKTDVENITGGSGNDTITGSSVANTITGGSGNDTINGGDGNDKLSGDSGSDSLTGEAGNDALDGGKNTDDLEGGPGNNTCTGGAAWWLEADSLDPDSCGDVNHPHLISFTPVASTSVTGINAAASSLTFRIEIQDDLSGLYGESEGSWYNGFVVFNPSGNEDTDISASCNRATIEVVTETSDGRILRLKCDLVVTWPRFSRHGQWEVKQFNAQDLAQNEMFHSRSNSLALLDAMPKVNVS